MTVYFDFQTLNRAYVAKKKTDPDFNVQQVLNLESSFLARLSDSQLKQVQDLMALCDWLNIDPRTLIVVDSETESNEPWVGIVSRILLDERLDLKLRRKIAGELETGYLSEITDKIQ